MVAILLASCRRDDYFEGSSPNITFSTDTLRFDTVFTTIGSATRYLKMYNHEAQPVRADVTLRDVANGFFRINVDGEKGPAVRQVEIGANDSIYVFVEVTIDPDKPLSQSPFIIEDFIDVSVNGSPFFTQLEAWGQNANYITPSDGKGKTFLYSCNLEQEVWDDPKPYVIYGVLYIDSCTVVLPAGTKIYVHGGIVRDSNVLYNDGIILFLKDGHLDARGTPNNPVIIQGDRLEKEFQDVKSQWVGMYFWYESRNNLMEHTIIKNSIIGIRVDSLAAVSMKGCQIYNTGGPAIVSRFADIYAENCLFYDNSNYGLQLTYGGNYEFNYCTVGSYEGQNEAVIFTDYFTTDPLDITAYRFKDLKARFTNCIFGGNDKDEVGIGNLSNGQNGFDYKFVNCAVKVKDLLKPNLYPDFFDFCSDCISLNDGDKLFLNYQKGDYRLDTMSVALGKALPLQKIQTDLLGKQRKSSPDLGCFEF